MQFFKIGSCPINAYHVEKDLLFFHVAYRAPHSALQSCARWCEDKFVLENFTKFETHLYQLLFTNCDLLSLELFASSDN